MILGGIRQERELMLVVSRPQWEPVEEGRLQHLPTKRFPATEPSRGLRFAVSEEREDGVGVCVRSYGGCVKQQERNREKR